MPLETNSEDTSVIRRNIEKYFSFFEGRFTLLLPALSYVLFNCGLIDDESRCEMTSSHTFNWAAKFLIWMYDLPDDGESQTKLQDIMEVFRNPSGSVPEDIADFLKETAVLLSDGRHEKLKEETQHQQNHQKNMCSQAQAWISCLSKNIRSFSDGGFPSHVERYVKTSIPLEATDASKAEKYFLALCVSCDKNTIFFLNEKFPDLKKLFGPVISGTSFVSDQKIDEKAIDAQQVEEIFRNKNKIEFLKCHLNLNNGFLESCLCHDIISFKYYKVFRSSYPTTWNTKIARRNFLENLDCASRSNFVVLLSLYQSDVYEQLIKKEIDKGISKFRESILTKEYFYKRTIVPSKHLLLDLLEQRLISVREYIYIRFSDEYIKKVEYLVENFAMLFYDQIKCKVERIFLNHGLDFASKKITGSWTTKEAQEYDHANAFADKIIKIRVHLIDRLDPCCEELIKCLYEHSFYEDKMDNFQLTEKKHNKIFLRNFFSDENYISFLGCRRFYEILQKLRLTHLRSLIEPKTQSTETGECVKNIEKLAKTGKYLILDDPLITECVEAGIFTGKQASYLTGCDTPQRQTEELLKPDMLPLCDEQQIGLFLRLCLKTYQIKIVSSIASSKMCTQMSIDNIIMLALFYSDRCGFGSSSSVSLDALDSAVHKLDLSMRKRQEQKNDLNFSEDQGQANAVPNYRKRGREFFKRSVEHIRIREESYHADPTDSSENKKEVIEMRGVRMS